MTAYRTCELATLAKDGTPITWPTSPWLRDDGKLVLTTSLGFPQKAYNVRRDNRVAMLFSDPTGSGLDAPKQVFVSGTASCPEEISTAPGELTEYWSMLFERQPSGKAHLSPLMRPLGDWYYMRLVITITPEAVTTRPTLVSEPRTGPGKTIVDSFDTAVLGAQDTDGKPVLIRVRPEPTEAGYQVNIPSDIHLESGPASLLVHSHDEMLANLRLALVRGRLAGDTFTPSQTVEPIGSNMRVLRQGRKNTKEYLRKRGLSRPKVNWAAFTELVK
nr:pyridoxamine 5'-phosphate oxidase-related, FMN-binding [Kibdelosporangium sp. MJ126-NF4]